MSFYRASQFLGMFLVSHFLSSVSCTWFYRECVDIEVGDIWVELPVLPGVTLGKQSVCVFFV